MGRSKNYTDEEMAALVEVALKADHKYTLKELAINAHENGVCLDRTISSLMGKAREVLDSPLLREKLISDLGWKLRTVNTARLYEVKNVIEGVDICQVD